MISFSAIFLCVLCLLSVYLITAWQWKTNKQSFYYIDKPFLFAHRGSPNYISEKTAPIEKKKENK